MPMAIRLFKRIRSAVETIQDFTGAVFTVNPGNYVVFFHALSLTVYAGGRPAELTLAGIMPEPGG
jgi:hypothetical protein